MKNGRISSQLAAVLRDKKATSSLRSSITRGETVKMRVEGKTYRVSSRAASKSGDESSYTDSNKYLASEDR